MKIFTKSLFALVVIAATPALADDNQMAQVFERAASYQNAVPTHSADYVSLRGTAATTTQTSNAAQDAAYRAEGGK